MQVKSPSKSGKPNRSGNIDLYVFELTLYCRKLEFELHNMSCFSLILHGTLTINTWFQAFKSLIPTPLSSFDLHISVYAIDRCLVVHKKPLQMLYI